MNQLRHGSGIIGNIGTSVLSTLLSLLIAGSIDIGVSGRPCPNPISKNEAKEGRILLLTLRRAVYRAIEIVGSKPYTAAAQTVTTLSYHIQQSTFAFLGWDGWGWVTACAQLQRENISSAAVCLRPRVCAPTSRHRVIVRIDLVCLSLSLHLSLTETKTN